MQNSRRKFCRGQGGFLSHSATAAVNFLTCMPLFERNIKSAQLRKFSPRAERECEQIKDSDKQTRQGREKKDQALHGLSISHHDKLKII